LPYVAVEEAMEDSQLIRISKFLSKYLRHEPERLGITLELGGWVSVDVLLRAAAAHGVPLTRAELEEVVARNDKQRFAFDETGLRIRANQGHTVPVDLQLESATPPSVLYHGTSEGVAPFIRREGLRKMQRNHVHLSADVDTAVRVGRRHGRPVIFLVDAAAMAHDGFTFYRAENGVWLVDSVPPRYLRELPPQASK
jgi:putative RNA 2'-phosphotransferase